MFQKILPPKSELGSLRSELVEEFGFDMTVLLPATHDTGSAVVAVPESEDSIYISSGTWSLIGVENTFPITITKAQNYNLTNECSLDYRFQIYEIIIGRCNMQEVKRLYKHPYSFENLADLAEHETDFQAKINVDDDRILNPKNINE